MSLTLETTTLHWMRLKEISLSLTIVSAITNLKEAHSVTTVE